MDNVIITVASRGGISRQFSKAIEALEPRAIVCIDGVSDVTLARNIQLTECEKFWENADTVLMLDDDIVIHDSDAQDKLRRLVAHSVESRVASSGLYVDKTGFPTCSILRTDNNKLWVTGLGVLAVPVSLLSELKKHVKNVTMRDRLLTCYTASHAEFNQHANEYQWMSEDFTLTNRLGGVHLFPELSFAHNKTMPLSPSPNTIETLASYISGDICGVK